MNEHERQATRDWAQRWTHLVPVLNNLERDAAEQIPLAELIPRFNDAFQAALLNNPPKKTSGLVELQAVFARWRK